MPGDVEKCFMQFGNGPPTPIVYFTVTYSEENETDKIYKAPCQVEGCEYGGGIGCGLDKLPGIDNSLMAFDAGAPIVRDCKAHKLTDVIMGVTRDANGKKSIDLSKNQWFLASAKPAD